MISMWWKLFHAFLSLSLQGVKTVILINNKQLAPMTFRVQADKT